MTVIWLAIPVANAEKPDISLSSEMTAISCEVADETVEYLGSSLVERERLQ